MTDTEAAAAPEGNPATHVIVAVADEIDGSTELPAALLSQVIRPVLKEFPVEVHESLDIGPPEKKGAAGDAPLPIVVAEVAGAPPEVLLALAAGDSGAGRTILLAPTTASGAPKREGVVRYPPDPEAVRAEAKALGDDLRRALVGDRTRIAAGAQRVRADAVSTGRLKLLRRIEAGTLPLHEPDPALTELCLAYVGLGRPGDVLRLVEAPTRGAARSDASGFDRPLAWAYAFALNRKGFSDEAERILDERIASGDADAEVHAALGRVHKDRWEAGGPKADTHLKKAIAAYAAGFEQDSNYYPGVNALTLMVLANRSQRTIDGLAREVLTSMERGRNPDEHPWWYWATRVQLEVIRGDFDAAEEALDGLLGQPSEPWMRESSALDLARLAERQNRRDPTPETEVADSPLTQRILEIRQAVLNGRVGKRGMPAHCVLEATRRGGDRWVNFTNSEPRPLFCRGSKDDNRTSVLAGDPITAMLEEADEARRRRAIATIGSTLQSGFRLDEGSVAGPVAATPGEYLVLQVDEETALEPWEFLIDDGGVLSLKCSFARRLWLDCRTIRRRSATRSSRALVIGDPLGDLGAAQAEATAVAEQLERSPAFSGGVVTLIPPERATLEGVRAVLQEGGVDLLHYAGHAVEGSEDESPGLMLADGLLVPTDLGGWEATPTIVFANACSSADLPEATRVRKAFAPSFVTELSQLGVGVFLGCAWPVGDVQAAFFSQNFYGELLAGRSVGHSVRHARILLREKFGPSDPYWGAYVLYGNPWYCFVDRTSRTRIG